MLNLYYREAFTNPVTKQFYKEGEVAKFPLLAKTLETLADEGPQTFYNGSLAKKILQDLKEAGIIHMCIVVKNNFAKGVTSQIAH